MKKFRNAILIIATAATAGCQKGTLTPGTSNAVNGTYRGKLFVVYTKDGFHTGPITDTVSLKINNGTYKAASSCLPGTHILYPGSIDSGTYKMQKDSLYTQELLAHSQNYDQGLNLEWSYQLQAKGDSLIMTNTLGGNTYTYRLKKQ